MLLSVNVVGNPIILEPTQTIRMFTSLEKTTIETKLV